MTKPPLQHLSRLHDIFKRRTNGEWKGLSFTMVYLVFTEEI